MLLLYLCWSSSFVTTTLQNLYPPSTRTKRNLALFQGNLRLKETKHREELLKCHLPKQQTTTTMQAPYPDYPEFHKIFIHDTYPPTTTTTTPAPILHQPFETFPDNSPPSPYSYRHTRDTDSRTYQLTPDNSDTNNLDHKQILAAVGAIGGSRHHFWPI